MVSRFTYRVKLRGTSEVHSLLDDRDQLFPSYQVTEQGDSLEREKGTLEWRCYTRFRELPSSLPSPDHHIVIGLFPGVPFVKKSLVFNKKQIARHSKNKTPELVQEPNSGMTRPL